MRYRDRVERLQASLADDEAAVIYPGPNTEYLAGVYGEPYDRHFLLVVPAEGAPWFVSPRKSLVAVGRAPYDRVEPLEANDPAAVAERLLSALPTSVDRLRVDDRAPYSVTGTLAGEIDLAPVAPLLDPLRLHKDSEEVAALRRAAALADEVSRELRALGGRAVGRTEADLASEIRARLHRGGATRRSFDVVVASGPHAAQPYYRSGDRRVREDEPVVLDFGGFVDGYAADQSRAVVFAGDPSERFREAHATVLEALEAGVAAAEPGVTAAEVHHATNDVLLEAGYGENLLHGTGHGVGVEAHEPPAIDEGSDVELEPGTVFSVEPGVYFEDETGTRVEDLVAVTEDGAERLNRSPRGWAPL